MTAPDFLPVLSAGAHSSPTQGACVMEYVSLLAGEAWSDSPACTHPVLAAAARRVNDGLPDSERHRLVPFIGRLFGTAPAGTEHEQHVLSVRLACWSARQVLPLVRERDRAVCEAAITAGEGWCDGKVSREQARTAGAADAAGAAYAADGVQFLNDLIAEHDRLTGRTERRQLNTADYAALASATR